MIDPWSEGAIDKDKTQGRGIQSTGLVISDGIAKGDGLDDLTIKELVKRNASQTEGQIDRQIFIGDGFQ